VYIRRLKPTQKLYCYAKTIINFKHEEMNNLQNYLNAIPENGWVDLQEIKRFLAEQSVETDRRMKKLQDLMGSWSDNHGAFAEEYFFNSFENGQQNFFGEKFDEIEKNLKPKKKKNIEDEYDIVMSNGSSVAIVEVKFKAHARDIDRVKNKASTYRVLCPEYRDYKIYLGLASLSFYPELEQECIAEGIAVIKQVGENVVINDNGLKVF
jgi:hypothetical protein